MPVLLLVAAAAWSGFWFFAPPRSRSRPTPGAPRRRNRAGLYDCAKRAVAGFPFRLEVRCSGASVALRSQTAEQAATRAPVTPTRRNPGRGADCDPKRLIAEFTAPATISDRGGPPAMLVNWSKARSSVVGLPPFPQRGSIVFDDPSIDRVNGAGADAAGARQTGRAARPPGRRLGAGSPGDRDRAEDRRRQRAGSCIRCCGAVSTPTCGRC